jgi:hypothetical protein
VCPEELRDGRSTCRATFPCLAKTTHFLHVISLVAALQEL